MRGLCLFAGYSHNFVAERSCLSRQNRAEVAALFINALKRLLIQTRFCTRLNRAAEGNRCVAWLRIGGIKQAQDQFIPPFSFLQGAQLTPNRWHSE